MNKKTMTAGLLTCALMITCAMSVSAQEAKAETAMESTKTTPATEIVKFTPINKSDETATITFTKIEDTATPTDGDVKVIEAIPLKAAVLAEKDGTEPSKDDIALGDQTKMMTLTPAK